MTWNKAEAKIIEDQGKTLKKIEVALVGDIETKEPGMIDDVRDIKSDIEHMKGKLKSNKKQHIRLFIISSLSLVLILYHLFGEQITFNGVLKIVTEFIKAGIF